MSVLEQMIKAKHNQVMAAQEAAKQHNERKEALKAKAVEEKMALYAKKFGQLWEEFEDKNLWVDDNNSLRLQVRAIYKNETFLFDLVRRGALIETNTDAMWGWTECDDLVLLSIEVVSDDFSESGIYVNDSFEWSVCSSYDYHLPAENLVERVIDVIYSWDTKGREVIHNKVLALENG